MKQFIEIQKVYGGSLRNVAENVIGSNATKMPKMKETLKTLAVGALSYITPNDPTKTGKTDYRIGDLVLDKNGDTYLYMGTGNDAILVRKK